MTIIMIITIAIILAINSMKTSSDEGVELEGSECGSGLDLFVSGNHDHAGDHVDGSIDVGGGGGGRDDVGTTDNMLAITVVPGIGNRLLL